MSREDGNNMLDSLRNNCGFCFVEIMNFIFMIFMINSTFGGTHSAAQMIAILFLWIFMMFAPVFRLKKNRYAYENISRVLLNLKKYITEDKNRLLKNIILLAGIFLIPYFIQIFLERNYGVGFNTIIYLCVIFALLMVLAVALYLKSDNKRPENLFLAFLLISGTTFILMSPVQLGISWDDQIHYDRTESIVDLVDGYGLKVDEKITSDFVKVTGITGSMEGYSKEDRLQDNHNWNELYKYNKFGIQNESFGIWSIAYVPYAIGAIIGRGLFLPFTWIFRLSKFCNLLFYGLIVWKGAKKLKSGKIAVLTVGLMPTTVFMASSFSYDPWVTAWILYGFCYFLSFLQDRSRIMCESDEIKMIGAFVLGCLPKAIYFMIMLPLFFMPGTSFKNRKDHIRYLFLVLSGGLFLIATFVLPVFFHGAGTGDARGGTGVNASEQINFILSEPLTYGKILLTFLGNYLNISNAGQYTLNFAYQGSGKLAGLSILIIFGTILLDKNGKQDKNWPIIISTMAGFFLSVVLAATSLYISYTPVRYHTINGCQFRYIIPVLFPFVYMITPYKIVNRMNEKWFCIIPFAVLTGLFTIHTAGVMYLLY